jgi:hypothetical protein
VIIGRNQSAVVSALSQLLSLCPEIAIESDSLLIVGASDNDLAIARLLGFKNITCSNLNSPELMSLDAENMALPDGSYDVVFIHAVLHHCQSPHKAALEATRVSRKAFIFLQGNDSFLMRLAIRFGFHNPYEVGAVSANNYKLGGLRNTPIPNYVYRWSNRVLQQTVYCGFPHRDVLVRSKQFFDFYLTPDEFKVRGELPLRVLRAALGANAAIATLRFSQRILNAIPGLRSQGNHFAGIVSKRGYKPWIEVAPEYVGLRRTR